MKIEAQKIYVPLFVLVILLQLYQPSFKINIFIQILALMFCVFLENIRFSNKFLQYIYTLVVLLLLGFIGTVINKYKVYDIIKDIVHFLKPITGLLIGYIVFRRIDNFKVFLQTIVNASVISAFIHFGIILFLVGSHPSLEDIREYTKDNFLELFGLFFIIFYKIKEGISLFQNKLYIKLAIVVLAISNILYFSRTMIIVAVILVLSVYGLTKVTRRNLKIVGVLLLCTGLLYAYLYSVNIQRDKRGLDGFLYKVKMAPEEIFTTNIDRDNLRDLYDHWRGYEAKRAFALMNSEPLSYLVGTGHGSLVNLKFYAPLTGEPKGIRYIAELHNGYVYVLYKTGILGILIYLLILGRWYSYIYKGNSFRHILVSGIGAVYFSSSITITGIYNGRDIIIFILGGALYYAGVNYKKPVIIQNSHAQ